MKKKKKRMPVLKCQQHCSNTESFCETVMILLTWGLLNRLKSGSLNGTNHENFQVAVHVSRTPPSGAEVTGEIELFI